MSEILQISKVSKIYKNKFQALDNLTLSINEGEIFALLGPNGAGKSTLINTICGILNFDNGDITVNNFDIKKQYREARSLIGIVPQELNLEAFETVWNNVNYSRGLYGKPSNHEYIEKLLKELSLWEKKNNKLRELSGGMKRRVLIAKALSHEPKILFLDEPTASVDVELRKDMWEVVKRLKKNGVTIILTTHYIEEAEALCDEVAIINNGEIIEQDAPANLINMLGDNIISVRVGSNQQNLNLSPFDYKINDDFIEFKTKNPNKDLPKIISKLNEYTIEILEVHTSKSSLEEVFVKLTND